MYSLISIRIMCFSSSNNSYARVLATSVLPTPVGPKNINEPIGLFGSLIPALALIIASLTSFSALSCPFTRVCKLVYKFSILSFSLLATFDIGMLVHLLITFAMSSLVTVSDSIPFLLCFDKSSSFSCSFGNISFLILAAFSRS